MLLLLYYLQIAIMVELSIAFDALWTHTFDHFEEFSCFEILKAVYQWVTDYFGEVGIVFFLPALRDQTHIRSAPAFAINSTMV
jgi:hypothetical protein